MPPADAQSPPSATAGPLRVFVSYSRDDIAFADQLVAALELTGFDVALDRHGITGGEEFQRRLEMLIREADTVVFVLSPSSARSEMCAWEVAEASRLGKRIIPVLCRALDGVEPPPRLKSLDYVFFYSEPKVAGSGFGHGLVRLVAALNTDLDWLREHTRLLARATEWDHAGRPANRLLSGADIPAAKQWAAARPKGAPEPTALHLDYIRDSEDAEAARFDHERKRLEDVARMQAERGDALAKAEQAQKDKEDATKRVVRRTRIGAAVAVVLALAAMGAWYQAQQNQQAALRETRRAERNLTAVTEALKVLDTETEPKRVAQAFRSIARNLVTQNRLDEGITLLRRARAISETQFGVDSPEVAGIRLSLADALERKGDTKQAIAEYEAAIAHHDRAKSTRTVDYSLALAMLQLAYKAAGETTKAEETKVKLRDHKLQQAAVLLPVYFGTDRARAADSGPFDYTSDRARRLDIGKVIVTVPKISQASSIDRPLSFGIFSQSEDPKKHFTIERAQVMTGDELAADQGKAQGEAAQQRDVLVYVPGFNTSFEAALFRAAHLAYNLEFEGPVVVYSWPSGGGAASYTYDVESAGQAVPHFVQFLELVASWKDARISIVAHSLGGQLAMKAVRDLGRRKAGSAHVKELILVAPDMDRDAFAAAANAVKGLVGGITLYASAQDRGLVTARNFFGGVPRAGDVPAEGPLVVPGVDTVDVTASANEVPALSHSGPSDRMTFLRDLGLLLKRGDRPPDVRSPLFERVQSPSGVYWRIPAR